MGKQACQQLRVVPAGGGYRAKKEACVWYEKEHNGVISPALVIDLSFICFSSYVTHSQIWCQRPDRRLRWPEQMVSTSSKIISAASFNRAGFVVVEFKTTFLMKNVKCETLYYPNNLSTKLDSGIHLLYLSQWIIWELYRDAFLFLGRTRMDSKVILILFDFRFASVTH